MITVEVALADGRAYPVLVGPGVRHRLAEAIPAPSRRAAVVTQPGIGVVVDPGIEHRVFTMADGETAKTLSTVEDLCRSFAEWGLTRSDVVVSVGGGVVTDVAGFTAATYHRGVAVIHVATTLLAQIDAAIGGKTGVNLPEGKNLVGAFWQPVAVLCDTATRCVESKAAVVAEDEHEAGRRAILNYGHTLGHALEAVGGYGLRHGEAVAIGLVYAAELARALGRIDDDRVAEHRRVGTRYGLSATLPEGTGSENLVEVMARDKKAVNGLTFVLDGPDGLQVVAGIDAGLARAVLEHLR